MSEQDDQLWAYDEPHDSGGSVHVTMTRRQAIDWMRSVYAKARPENLLKPLAKGKTGNAKD